MASGRRELLAETWLSKKALAAALHCSQRTIDNLVAAGVFAPGTAFYRVGLKGGAQVFELQRCRAAMLRHTAELEHAAMQQASSGYDEGRLHQLLQEVR